MIKKVFYFVLPVIWGTSVFANSYIDMITQKPEGATLEEQVAPLVAAENVPQTEKTRDLWYDSRIRTKSPVVVSPYPKYFAWRRAQALGDVYDSTRDEIQALIYMLEGGLVGWGLYEIYRYR